ncbi:MAG: lipopolysaccharide kinase InaA family protein [Rikenellaceae bacterium]
MESRRRKVVVAPEYEFLSEFINSIPDNFPHIGTTIRDVRNCVKYVDIDDSLCINIKRYCIPKLMHNRLVYRRFRKTKAQRAYEYAEEFLHLGINTPTPIGYIVEEGTFFISYCYLITVQASYTRDMAELREAEVTPLTKKIAAGFGRYTAKMHENGYYHNDYGANNILLDVVDEEPEYCVIDINRMYIGEVSQQKGCRNFDKLGWSPKILKIAAEAYALARGFDKEQIVNSVIYGKKEMSAYKKLWKRLKKIFK